MLLLQRLQPRRDRSKRCKDNSQMNYTTDWIKEHIKYSRCVAVESAGRRCIAQRCGQSSESARWKSCTSSACLNGNTSQSSCSWNINWQWIFKAWRKVISLTIWPLYANYVCGGRKIRKFHVSKKVRQKIGGMKATIYKLRTIGHCCYLFTLDSSCSIVYLCVKLKRRSNFTSLRKGFSKLSESSSMQLIITREHHWETFTEKTMTEMY